MFSWQRLCCFEGLWKHRWVNGDNYQEETAEVDKKTTRRVNQNYWYKKGIKHNKTNIKSLTFNLPLHAQRRKMQLRVKFQHFILRREIESLFYSFSYSLVIQSLFYLYFFCLPKSISVFFFTVMESYAAKSPLLEFVPESLLAGVLAGTGFMLMALVLLVGSACFVSRRRDRRRRRKKDNGNHPAMMIQLMFISDEEHLKYDHLFNTLLSHFIPQS